MDRAAYLDRTRHRGINPILYWLVRAVLQPFFHLYFRMSRIGREHVIQDGPMIIAANHRSFLDPFVIGTIVRRPVYFVAKKELFRRPLTAWFLNSLGAFPIDRGNADGDAMATAREILERGDVVVIFPEGTRTRPGALGTPKRGVGRLALETGAPVLPVAVIGTEAIRRGWRIRPHKVRIRVGSPLRFPKVERPSPDLARAVTGRIWPCVALQWEWLGGLAPVRRAAVAGEGEAAAMLTATLQRAGVETERIDLDAPPELAGHDLVAFAMPARELPAAVTALQSRIARRAGVLVAVPGLVGEGGTPTDYVARHTGARAVAALGGPAGAPVVASTDPGFARQLGQLLRAGGVHAAQTTDVARAELDSLAATVASLASARDGAAAPDPVALPARSGGSAA